MTEPSKQIKEEKQIGDYLLGQKLGIGGFAKVVLGTHVLTKEKVAIKILNIDKLVKDDNENLKKVKKEIEILKLVKHKNIIKLYDVINTSNKIYLIMELCEGGELFDIINSKQYLTELDALKYFQEYIDAIDYLHSQKIVHRDLKPENMLLDSSQSIKLIDFGISSKYSRFLSTPCGTTSYAPPEMHKGEKYLGMLSDVWSSGIVLYAMVCGYLPFFDEDEDIHVQTIIQGKLKIPSRINPLLQDMIKQCLKINPSERITINQIKRHPWFNSVTPILRQGLIIGLNTIPIDEQLVDIVESFISNKEEIRNNLLTNQYNSITSFYYILLKKKQREGYTSVSDLVSDQYVSFISGQINNIFLQNETLDDNVRSSTQNNQPTLNYSKAVMESQACYNNTPSTSIIEQNSTPPKTKNNYINYIKPNGNGDHNSRINKKIYQRQLVKKINNQTHANYHLTTTSKVHHNRCLSERGKNYSISQNKNKNPNKIHLEKIPIKPRKLSSIILNDKELAILKNKKNNIFNNHKKLKQKPKPIQLLYCKRNYQLIPPNSSKRNGSFESNQQTKIVNHMNRSVVLQTENNENSRIQPTTIKRNKLNNSTVLINNLNPCNLSMINYGNAQISTEKNKLIIKNPKKEKVQSSQINFNQNKSPKQYKGFVDLRCVSLDTIDSILNKITNYFISKQITYANVAPYKYHCSKYGEIFDIEICSMLNNAKVGNNQVYYISLLSKQGNIKNQNSLVNQLFPL